MGREHLSNRDNWQSFANQRGQTAENIFSHVMSEYCEDSNGIIAIPRPKDLRGIYGQHPNSGRPHGVVPDFSFHNPQTEKTFYVEMKRQGDAGNAHERACKYLTPGILQSIREAANQPESVIPMWFIFSNGIARSARYQQEIKHWFKGHDGNLLLWEDFTNIDILINHFETHIKPHLL